MLSPGPSKNKQKPTVFQHFEAWALQKPTTNRGLSTFGAQETQHLGKKSLKASGTKQMNVFGPKNLTICKKQI